LGVTLDVFLVAFLLWFLYLMMVMMMKELYNMLGCGFFFGFVWVFGEFERLRD
jgi:glucose uptake protein GlcU